MIDVTVAIVSLNTRDLLAACLRSVFASTGVSLDVWVVDNRSTDGSAEMVARDFPSARLVRNDTNRGFAAANNVAIRDARSRYVLLLNPDTVIPHDAIRELVAFMDAHPKAGICGPQVRFPDGRFQSCGYRFPTLAGEIRQSKRSGALMRRLVGEETPLEVPGHPVEREWVDGCCLLIRASTVKEIGLLDEQYFLYAEELDWCFQARACGWQVYAVPPVTIVHYLGQSSSQISDFSLGCLVETRLRYYRKNHGVGTAAVISVVYILGCLKQLRNDPRKNTVKLRAALRWWWTLLPA
jgi:N-acetylglucosaminyl-diphospho-decaprenol L-rhamnosyltransferase